MAPVQPQPVEDDDPFSLSQPQKRPATTAEADDIFGVIFLFAYFRILFIFIYRFLELKETKFNFVAIFFVRNNILIFFIFGF